MSYNDLWINALPQGESGTAYADEVWAELKALRKAPRWHRTSWAAKFGFSSYGKFFRACILMFGATPHEVEIALIEELLSEEQNDGKATDDQNRDRQGASSGSAGAEEVEVVKRE